MVKKLLLFSSFIILLFSCNKVIDAVDEVRMNKKETITYDDFEAIRNDYDIKLYYDNDKELKSYKEQNAKAWKDILGGTDFQIVEEEQAYNDITTYTDEPQ